MRHERPEPGRPTPIPEINAELLKAKLIATPLAERARRSLPATIAEPETRAVIVADMVDLLDQGRVERGYADIYDLMRAGYAAELCASLGPEAAKIMAANIAARGVEAPFGDSEAA